MDPRVVMVRRETAYEALLREHGTFRMAEFRLAQRGERLDTVRERHDAVLEAAQTVLGRVPTTWRKTWVLRRDLDRFRFDPEDLIIAVGLDGLVPNVAKYLRGQPVIGVNPTEWEQQMMHFRADDVPHLYASYRASSPAGGLDSESRTMVQVDLDDGRSLVALNEVFCGHTSHQSAKYDIAFAQTDEYQSSSGIIVSTGTGATGWASSIARATQVPLEDLPCPVDPAVYFLVREAWVSNFTGGTLLRGRVEGGASARALRVTSKMEHGGVLFGDGIESDALTFAWGQTASFAPSRRSLTLVLRGSDEYADPRG